MVIGGMECRFKTVKLSDPKLSYENCLFTSPAEKSQSNCYLEVTAGRSNTQHFLFTFKSEKTIQPGCLAVSRPHREWAYLGVNSEYRAVYRPRENYQLIDEVNFNVEFYKKQLDGNGVMLNTDKMADEVRGYFKLHQYAISTNQPFVFKLDGHVLLLTMSELPDSRVYRVDGSTKVTFENAPNSMLKLSGKSRSKKARSNIINPNFNFQELGIGGLDEEFKEIFRRAFASRNLPPDVVERMGAKHVKGILLHGPPGCGKTLTARQIGKMLSAREPKIVNGPEILNKFVGESESNIRKLFEDAEEEQKRLGSNSGLHIIIFDEIDAICKQRGSVQGASGVHDTVVNQLLSKIDGVEPLNNILVIGMTNRPDLIDEALLRPGRLEVKKEIGLPDENGRLEVLTIHTKKMIESEMLAGDVSLEEIAKLTKNFSGAELAGLVRGAQSCAIVRHVKVGRKVELDSDAIDDIKISRDDFMNSLSNDIKPAYGSKEEDFEKYMRNGVLVWDSSIQDILDHGQLYIKQVKNSTKTPLMSVLLTGETGCGKTALAVKIALESSAPFIKICSPQSMIGYSEHAKCQHIKKIFDDAFRSEMSCIVVDDIERLIDYNPIGNRYSNLVAQTLHLLLNCKPPLGKRLLIIATSSAVQLLEAMEMTKIFGSHLHVPCLMNETHVKAVLDEIDTNWTEKERTKINKGLEGCDVMVGIKNLIRIIATSEQSDDDRSETFLNILRQDAKLQKR